MPPVDSTPLHGNVAASCPETTALSQLVRSAGTSTAKVPSQSSHMPTPVRHPASTAPSCRRPSDLQVLITSEIPLHPRGIAGPMLHCPAQMVAVLELPRLEETMLTHFTVFDVDCHHRTRRRLASWSIAECVADAATSAVTRVRHVQILLQPLQGLPVPQLVLTPATAPPAALAMPIDARPVSIGVPPPPPPTFTQLWRLFFSKKLSKTHFYSLEKCIFDDVLEKYCCWLTVCRSCCPHPPPFPPQPVPCPSSAPVALDVINPPPTALPPALWAVHGWKPLLPVLSPPPPPPAFTHL